MLYGPRGILNLARARDRKDGERGQILVLFTMVIVILMVCSAIVIDVGLLRTDGARLQNALDAGALAAAQSLPATSANIGAVKAKAIQYATDNYPGLSTAAADFASFQCIVGADDNGRPRLIDMPAVCNVSFAVNSPKWVCTAALCWAPCDPTIDLDGCLQHHCPEGFRRAAVYVRPRGWNQRTCHRHPASGRLHGTLRADLARRRRARHRPDPEHAEFELDPEPQERGQGGPEGLRSGIPAGRAGHARDRRRRTRRAPGRVVPPSGPCPWSPHPRTSPVAPRPSWTQSNATVDGGATSLTINRPGAATATTGDLLVAAITVIGGKRSRRHAPGRATAGRSSTRPTTRPTSRWSPTTSSPGSEPASYLWNFSGTVRASGGVVRYAGVDPASPIDKIGAGATGNSTAVAAPSLTTTVDNTELVGFFATAANTTFAVPTGGGWTERFDRRITSPSTSGPATEVADFTMATAGATDTRTATAGSSGQWAAQMIALRPPGLPRSTARRSPPTSAIGCRSASRAPTAIPSSR